MQLLKLTENAHKLRHRKTLANRKDMKQIDRRKRTEEIK